MTQNLKQFKHKPNNSGISCTSIGQTTSKPKVDHIEIAEGYGSSYYKASCRVTSIMSEDVDGPELQGIGKTEEIALQRLDQAIQDFNNTLWE